MGIACTDHRPREWIHEHGESRGLRVMITRCSSPDAPFSPLRFAFGGRGGCRPLPRISIPSRPPPTIMSGGPPCRRTLPGVSCLPTMSLPVRRGDNQLLLYLTSWTRRGLACKRMPRQDRRRKARPTLSFSSISSRLSDRLKATRSRVRHDPQSARRHGAGGWARSLQPQAPQMLGGVVDIM